MDQAFDPRLHIVNLTGDIADGVSDGAGGFFEGIHGRSGARSATKDGLPVGVDVIRMRPGSSFQPHVHPGAHILVIREGGGSIEIDSKAFPLHQGDSIFVPADLPHAVSADAASGLEFLAFGVPHVPIHSPHRMALVESTAAEDRQ